VIRIPLHKAPTSDANSRYVAECLNAGQLRGDGLFTARCHRWLEQRLGRQIFLTTSCTAALEMAVLLLGLKPGDEVICPSFTFVSTANAFLSRGVTLVFADIRSDTLNLDERLLGQVCTPKTKVIVPMHYAGAGCEMDAIIEFARDAGIHVIEDAAHGFGSKYKGRHLGTIGDVGCYSFHETKGVSCGEGGAIVINRPADSALAEIIWDKGTDRRAFLRRDVSRYTWKSVGSSFLPSDMVAAFLLGQLERFGEDACKRKRLYEEYERKLESLVREGFLTLPAVPEHCEVVPDLFYVLLSSRQVRDDLMEFLNRHGIGAAFHYLPLHLSDVGRQLGYKEGAFPVAESISSRLLRLPFFAALTRGEMGEVVDHLYRFFRTQKPVGV
jgi:dTDP-4-amino-4,6-dideoxygalactose transaminase